MSQCSLRHGMLATLYTEDSLRSLGMRSELHNSDPQRVLARNLKAALAKRELSTRALARELAAKGKNVSNRTIQNMVNGEGNPQLDGLMAVAVHLRISLWQLLCPGMDARQFDDQTVHALLDNFAGLSEVGRARVLRDAKAEAALENVERASTPSSSNENAT